MLPEFNANGDLPPGVHAASLPEIITRFGNRSVQRQEITARLQRIYTLAVGTGKLQHFVIFGSYVTVKPAPNDVDIMLVMQNDFSVALCEAEPKQLFDHEQADSEFGASIFWIRPALLILETLESFVAHWQVKRDGMRRGIVEIIP